MYSRRTFIRSLTLGTFGACLAGKVQAGDTPLHDTHYFVLGDGRKLGYVTFGDPHSETTILYFHGMPTSRLEARMIHEDALTEQVRIIALDRPGIGLSSFQSNRAIVDWPQDVLEFTQGLGLHTFSIMGISSGGPFALACALLIPSPQLQSVALINGVAPLDAPVDAGNSARYYRLTRRNPRRVNFLLNRTTRGLYHEPEKVLFRITKRMAPVDRAFLCDPAHRQIFIDAYLESVQCGTRGVITDLDMLARSWGFCLADVPAKVRLWYGQCDRTTPVSIGEYLVQHLPHATLETFPNHGHLTLLTGASIRKILSAVRQDGLGDSIRRV